MNPFDQEKITSSIVKMICLDMQAFNIVENRGFKSLISALQPNYSMVTKKTLSKKYIPEIYEKKKELVVMDLKINHWIVLLQQIYGKPGMMIAFLV